MPAGALRRTGNGKTAEVVADRIRGLIVRGRLREGDALPPEHQLLDEFDVSRPTVREALRILESERLIYVKRGAGGGPRVTLPTAAGVARYAGLVLQLDGASAADVYHARTVIEEPALRMAGAHDLEGFCAALRVNLAEVEELQAHGSEEEHLHRMPALSREFHSIVVAFAGNPVLRLMSDMLSEVVEIGGRQYTRQVSDRRLVYDQAMRSHGRVLALLEDGEIEAADAIWGRHVTEVANQMVTYTDAQTQVIDLYP